MERSCAERQVSYTAALSFITFAEVEGFGRQGRCCGSLTGPAMIVGEGTICRPKDPLHLKDGAAYGQFGAHFRKVGPEGGSSSGKKGPLQATDSKQGPTLRGQIN